LFYEPLSKRWVLILFSIRKLFPKLTGFWEMFPIKPDISGYTGKELP
jgi:hypothetical protein